MKYVLALATILLASSVSAEELKFGDINFFLREGEINYVLDANQTFDKNTTAGDTRSTRSIIFQNVLAYALTDHLNFTLGIDYAHENRTKDTNFSPVDRGIKNDGLSNPSVGANYRLLNQDSQLVNLDFGAVARIRVQDAKIGTSSPTDSENGNYADGRNNYELNARVGRKWNEANEWQFVAGINYFAEGESTVQSTGAPNVDRRDNSSLDSFIRAGYQYRPVNEFMMLMSVQATRVGETTARQDGTTFRRDSHYNFDFGFVAKALITDNFIAKFNYVQSNLPTFDGRDGGTSVEIEKRRSHLFGFGVDFLF